MNRYYANQVEKAVAALMRRGEMHLGTPNKAAHKLVIHELGFDINALPYGLQSLEVVRKAKHRCAARNLNRDWLIL